MFQCSSASRKFLNSKSTTASGAGCAFQCSSASRKFLNVDWVRDRSARRMFQCSSASRKFLNATCVTSTTTPTAQVSVLFSEPKIPQCNRRGDRIPRRQVSVLFSEPKIPQSGSHPSNANVMRVSVLFSEPKIPQSKAGLSFDDVKQSFSALQRAENSSIERRGAQRRGVQRFSALQRAENSSIPTLAPASIHISDRDDHASSFLSLPGASP